MKELDSLHGPGLEEEPYSPSVSEQIFIRSFDSENSRNNRDMLNVFKRSVLGVVLGAAFCTFFYMPTMESCEKASETYICSSISMIAVGVFGFFSGFYLGKKLYR